MSLFTILRDNREQLPYEFDGYPVEVRDTTLTTGDYSIDVLCSYESQTGTYSPNFAVERKSGEDFLSSITNERERFKKEIKRASDWENPLIVVVETPWTTFEQNLGFMERRQVHPNQVKGTIQEWSRWYNVSFQFLGDRESGEEYAYDQLKDQLRSSIIQ